MNLKRFCFQATLGRTTGGWTCGTFVSKMFPFDLLRWKIGVFGIQRNTCRIFQNKLNEISEDHFQRVGYVQFLFQYNQLLYAFICVYEKDSAGKKRERKAVLFISSASYRRKWSKREEWYIVSFPTTESNAASPITVILLELHDLNTYIP